MKTTQILQRASDVSHLVIGGGSVGLAIAARLSQKNNTMLLERHSELGTETSARNSEVIHAGIYYPENSLRTKLCIQGKEMVYSYEKYGVEMQNCGKWVVAQNDKQQEYLTGLYDRAKVTGVPLNWVDLDKAKQIEPAVRANSAILESPTTGILSAHSLMSYYEAEMEKNGADVALGTVVEKIEKDGDGYIVYCSTGDGGDKIDIKADVVINSAGHGAVNIQNSFLPEDRHLTAYYAKGNYFSYGASRPKVSRLIYPCPSNHASLGTHLTLDLGGRMKFGPDIEWVENEMNVQVNGKNLTPAIDEIKQYLPEIDTKALTPDYSGIRPKITNDGRFQDFVIREEQGFPGFINLLNIESPGLTASPAIAEYVNALL